MRGYVVLLYSRRLNSWFYACLFRYHDDLSWKCFLNWHGCFLVLARVHVVNTYCGSFFWYVFMILGLPDWTELQNFPLDWTYKRFTNSSNLRFQEVLFYCLLVFHWLPQFCLFRLVQNKCGFRHCCLNCFFLDIYFLNFRNGFTNLFIFFWINCNLFHFLFQEPWLCTLNSLWPLVLHTLGLRCLHNISANLCFLCCLDIAYLALVFA